ncbi:hypothetical protein O2W14_19110 [Modestobacter sp. VKM Ac-2986]|uniref:hypothetical protein n=1 Tax=Modestobacter sp. VKM Ac-2986 TaxID=3004140 RepID=UPI0022AB900F|nr:hypothetical protein [Modestobacter sp. VKM Ac-2986]MCZ2830956.1 hypothetical protein [Modestobacter sp. VKM Ac-2986]
MVAVVVLLALGVLVGCAVRASDRRAPDDHVGLEGNDPARPGAVHPADARGAVNRNSWMLGGGGV